VVLSCAERGGLEPHQAAADAFAERTANDPDGFVHELRLWSTWCGRVRSVTVDLLVMTAEIA
jgi:hypothetical protein